MTTTVEKQQPATSEGFKAFLESRNEPAWLTEIRNDAWKRFESLAWPTNREEEWMRTDIRMFKLDKFGLPTGQSGVEVPRPVLDHGVDLGGSAACVDGIAIRDADFDAELAAKGVVFGNISSLLADHGDLVKKYLFQLVKGDEDRFAALHQAVFSSGAFLYVPRNVVVEKPIHLFAGLSDGGADYSHTVIVLEEGAEATVLAESLSDENATGFHNGAIELVRRCSSQLALREPARLESKSLALRSSKSDRRTRRQPAVDRWSVGFEAC